MAKRDLKYISLVYLLLKGDLDGDDRDIIEKIRRDVPNLKLWQRTALDGLIGKYLHRRRPVDNKSGLVDKNGRPG